MNPQHDIPPHRAPIVRDAVYLTNQAADAIGVKPETIRRAVRSGKIRGRGRTFRILGSELLRLVGVTP